MRDTGGSPPHTRERHVDFIRKIVTCRITPAYAGKTGFGWRSFFHSEDHPRIRGKDLVVYDHNLSYEGSPPHTRERLFDGFVGDVSFRITPAYAGKTDKKIP